MVTPSTSMIYEFDSYRVDALKRLLLGADNAPIPLKPKVFDTLVYLLNNSGQIIDKDELMAAIWPDAIVEENNLNKNISALRQALGDDRSQHRFIVTIPGRGYKFVAEVRTTENVNGEDVPTPPQIKERGSERPKLRFVLAAATGVLFVAVLVAASIFWRGQSSVQNNKATQTIAILPFRPLLDENRDEALELGMADTLISRIGNNRNVIVRPLSSVRGFGSLDQDAVAAGKALGVESVLEGSIQHLGDRIRVNVRFVKVADGSVHWTETFDEKFTDIFVVQDAISSRLSKTLSLQLSGDGRTRLTKHYTEKLEAYQAFTRGRYHHEKYTPQDSRKAIEYFQQAIAIDANFADAYAYLGAIYSGLAGANDFPRRETVLMARENVLKAISLDDQSSIAHEVYGVILSRYDYDFVGGERELKRAIDLDPNDASAHETYGGMLIPLGRFDEALVEMRRAAEINPLSASISSSVGNSLLFARRYDEAITQYKKSLELDERFTAIRYGLAIAYQIQGRYSESVEERAKLTELAGNAKGAEFIRQSFEQGGWQGFLREMTENNAAPRIPPYATASLYAELGEKDKAFAILNKLLEDKASGLIMLKVDPRFDSLRDDPRLVEILRQTNLD